MRNFLKRLQKQFSVYFNFFVTKFPKFSGTFSTEVFDEKFSFTPISFKLGSAYISEDSRKTIILFNDKIKNNQNFFCVSLRILSIFLGQLLLPLLDGGWGSVCRSLGRSFRFILCNPKPDWKYRKQPS